MTMNIWCEVEYGKMYAVSVTSDSSLSSSHCSLMTSKFVWVTAITHLPRCWPLDMKNTVLPTWHSELGDSRPNELWAEK